MHRLRERAPSQKAIQWNSSNFKYSLFSLFFFHPSAPACHWRIKIILPLFSQISLFDLIIPSNNSMVVEGIGMNTLRYPTNVTAVRQAIVHAINYTDISNKAFFGDLVPWVGPEFPTVRQYYDLGNFRPYTSNETVSQLAWLGSLTWADFFPTPYDAWGEFVSNQSAAGNFALYSTPISQSCVNAFTNGSSNSTITDLCTKAQAQIYDAAPYIWLGSPKSFYEVLPLSSKIIDGK
jgi:ABC-type transport system substrate-binding protein